MEVNLCLAHSLFIKGEKRDEKGKLHKKLLHWQQSLFRKRPFAKTDT